MHGRGCVWGGVHGWAVCVVGGHGRGACMAGGHAWQGGMHGKGACMVGEHAWLGACMVGGGYVWQGVCMVGGCGRGACVVGLGGVWQGACMFGGQAWQGVYVPHTPPTLRDTVGQCAGGTHPTGKHSCYVDWLRSTFYIIFSSISLSTCSACLSGFFRSYLSMHHIGPFMGHNRQYSF